jgi:hypothetical protein
VIPILCILSAESSSLAYSSSYFKNFQIMSFSGIVTTYISSNCAKKSSKYYEIRSKISTSFFFYSSSLSLYSYSNLSLLSSSALFFFSSLIYSSSSSSAFLLFISLYYFYYYYCIAIFCY